MPRFFIAAFFFLPALAPAQEAPAPGAPNPIEEEIFDNLRFLREEVRQLQGALEEQQKKTEDLQRRQLNQYIDLEARLLKLEEGTRQSRGAPGVESADNPAQAAAPPPGKAPEMPSSDEAQTYQQAYGLIGQRRYDEAVSSFTDFLQLWPRGEYAANAWYWLGELYLVKQPSDLESARRAFTEVYEKFPRHQKAPDATFKLGKVYHLLGDREQSKKMLNEVIEKYGAENTATKLAENYLRQYF